MTNEVRKSYDDGFILVPLDTFHYLTEKASPSSIVVYLALLARANRGKGDSCFPSLNTIAKDAGVSRRTVTTALAQLEDIGAITVESRMSPEGDATSNLYWIHRPSGGSAKPAPPPANISGGRENPIPTPGTNLSPRVGQDFPPNHIKSEPDEMKGRGPSKRNPKPVSGGAAIPDRRPPLTPKQMHALDPVADRELILRAKIEPVPPPGATLDQMVAWEDVRVAWKARR